MIEQLGNFENIRCPAKYAARIGQAFSDTSAAIKIGQEIVTRHADVRRNDRIFTDGCGSISADVLALLQGSSPTEGHPTAYQIRFQGILSQR